MPVRIHKLFPENKILEPVFSGRPEATNYIETSDIAIDETLIKDNFIITFVKRRMAPLVFTMQVKDIFYLDVTPDNKANAVNSMVDYIIRLLSEDFIFSELDEKKVIKMNELIIEGLEK